MDAINRVGSIVADGSGEWNRHIAEAYEYWNQIDQKSFEKTFLMKFSRSFHRDDLIFWCELIGLDSNEILQRFITTEVYKDFAQGVYVRNRITSIQQIKELFETYKLNWQQLITPIYHIFIEVGGNLFQAMQRLPYSYEVLQVILSKQDMLMPITGRYWINKKELPESLQNLSRYSHALYSNLDELILTTLVKAGHPLKLEELIYQGMGVILAPIEIKNMFLFMMEIVPVYRVEDTDYWALTEWEAWLDGAIINGIYERLEEEERQTLAEFWDRLTQWPKERILKHLQVWPEFIENVDGTYGLRAVTLNDEIIQLIMPELMQTLKRSPNGIYVSELHQQVQNILVSHGLSIQPRDFKQYLKTWGEAAIIRSKVFPMSEAPFDRLRLGDVCYLLIKEYGSPMPYAELEQELRSRRNYTQAFSSVLLIEPKLSRPSRGVWALKEWGLPEYDPEIHKQIGEILVNMILEVGRPVHKNEIRRNLRRRGMRMNEVTLHLDLTENEEITQVAKGVYALKIWDLHFRDLFKYNFPFRLSLPDGNPSVIELDEGALIEYTVTKACLELNRILIKRYMQPYFPEITGHLRYYIHDKDGDPYMGWADCMQDGRYQVLGLQRWFKTYKPRYGESVYLLKSNKQNRKVILLTSEQADDYFA